MTAGPWVCGALVRRLVRLSRIQLLKALRGKALKRLNKFTHKILPHSKQELGSLANTALGTGEADGLFKRDVDADPV